MRAKTVGKNRAICSAAVLAALASFTSVRAAPFTWDGGSAATNNWSDALNWSTNVAPLNDGSADLVFAGTTRLAPQADVAWSINSLSFNSTAGVFNVGGATLTIGAGGIVVGSSPAQAINNTINLGSTQTWSATTAGLSSNGSINMNGNGLTFSAANISSINGAITGSGTFTKEGSSTLIFTGGFGNTFSGPTNVNAGTLMLSKTVGNAISGALTIGDGLSAPLSDFVQLQQSNQILDSVAVTINSSGVFDLGSSSDTIGTLTMNAGLVTGSGGSTLIINGSGITTTASANTASVASNVLNFGPGTKTFTVADGTAAVDLDISSTINTAPGSLIKSGPGTMRFSGASSNLYFSLTNVNDGTLVLARSGFKSIGGSLVIGDGVGGINADVVRQEAADQVGTTATTTINSSGLLDIGAFSYITQNLIFNGGNITSSIGGNFKTFGSITSNAATTTATIGGAGQVDLLAGNRTFTVNDGAVALDMDISIPIVNGGLIKAGAGTLSFSGPFANAYTGTTSITGGTLVLNKPTANAIVGPISIGNNPGPPNTEVLLLSASNQISDFVTVTINNTGLFNINGNTETIANLSMTGGNVNLNSGALIITNTISTSNATVAANINGPGLLNLGNGTRIFDIVQPPVPIPIGMDISAQIINGGITKTDQGTLQFSGLGSNSYSGQTYVQEGTLLLAKTGVAVPGQLGIGNGILGSPTATVRLLASGQLGNGAGTYLSMNEGGLLDMNGFNATIRDLKLFGGDIIQNGGTLTMLGDAIAITDSISTISGGTLDIGGAAKSFDISGQVDIQSRVVNGIIAKLGPGTLRLSGNNTAVTALYAGTLLIGNDQALGIANLIVNGGTVSTDGVARVSPQPALILGPAIFDEAASLTLQSFSGNGSLTKNGVGTLAFTSGSTFAGPITLNTGTLSATLTSNNSFTQNGGIFSGSLTNQGTFTYNGGSFNGTLTNDGSVVLNADFTAATGMENHSNLTVSTGRTLTVNGTGLRNMGTFTLNGGTVAGSGGVVNDFSGQMNARGTINSALANLGTLQTNGLLVAASGINNFGVINIFSAQSLSLGGGAANVGTINLFSGSVSGSGSLLNNPGGQIQGGGGISAPLGNAGGLIFASSSLPLVISNLNGGNNSGGELRIADGSTLNIISPFTSSGTIVLQGANANLGGGAISNSGTISGRGRISNPLNNSGVVRAEGGLLTIAAGGATNTASGNIQAPADATVFFSQGLASNAGTIALSGGTFDTNATAITNSGVIDGRGIFRSGGLTNNNKIAIADGPSEFYGNLTNNASISITNTTATFFNNVTNNSGGVIKTTSAVSRFLATFINSGTFISDPSDNFFDSLVIGEKGALIGGVGDRFYISGDLVGPAVPDNKVSWQTSSAQLHFTGGLRHLLSLLGEDKGISFDGYDNNFAWGTLTLGAGQQLSLDGPAGSALYVHALVLSGGIDQISSITGNGHNLYYDLSNPANAYLAGQTYSLSGGGQIAPVPEPATICCSIMAAFFIVGRRRREND